MKNNMPNKFTPGPWVVRSTVIGGEPVHRVDGPPRGKPINWRPTAADAHLIAAAPDMLEALEKLLSCISETRGVAAYAATELARAAIKKARGEK